MDIYTFFNTFIEAVAQDADLDTWSRAQFGDSLTVYADVQSAALPTREDMPYAIFHTPEVSKHQERRDNQYIIGVDLALDTDAFKRRAEINLAEPAGLTLISDLVTKIMAAVVDALPANVACGYHLTADTLGALPEVHGYMDLEFNEKITIGVDPMD